MLKYILRNIRKGWLSAVLEVASLSLAIAVVYLSLNSGSDVLLSIRESAAAVTGGYDVTLSTENSLPELPEELDFGNAAGWVPVRLDNFTTSLPDYGYCLLISTYADTLEAGGLLKLSIGRMPQTQGEIALTESQAAELSLPVGTELTMTDWVTEEERTFTVVGVVEDADLFSDGTSAMLQCITAFTPGMRAQRFLVDVGVQEADRYGRDFCSRNPGWEYDVFLDNSPSARTVESTRQMLLLLTAVAILLAYSVISAVSTLQIDERVAVFAVFRSIGASKRMVQGLIFGENLLYALAGGLLGVGMGEAGRVFLIRRYFYGDDSRRGMNPMWLALCFALALVMQLAVTYTVSRKLNRRSIRSCMTEKPSAEARIHRGSTVLGFLCLAVVPVLLLLDRHYTFWMNAAALLLTIVGMALSLPMLIKLLTSAVSRFLMEHRPGPSFLAMRSHCASKINLSSIRLTVLAVAMCTMILFAVNSVVGFLGEYEKAYDYDIVIRGSNITAEQEEFIRTTPGVAEMKKEYYGHRATTIHRKESQVCFVKVHGYIGGVTMLGDADEDALAPGQAIVDAQFALNNDLHIGDTVPFFLRGVNGALVLNIVGLCDSGIYNTSRRTVLLSEADYNACIRNGLNRVSVILDGSVPAGDVLSRLKVMTYLYRDHDISVKSIADTIGTEVAKTNSAVQMFSMMPFLVAAMSLCGLLGNQIISFRKKRREYAVLYSVAMSRGQLYRMLVLEHTGIVTMGTVLGLLMGLFSAQIIQRVVYSLFAYIDMRIDPVLLTGTAAALMALSVIVCLRPYRVVYRLNMVQEIREE